jgi:hypothetical protein
MLPCACATNKGECVQDHTYRVLYLQSQFSSSESSCSSSLFLFFFLLFSDSFFPLPLLLLFGYHFFFSFEPVGFSLLFRSFVFRSAADFEIEILIMFVCAFK